MVVVMEERATEAQIEKVVASLVDSGMDVHRSTGVNRTVLGKNEWRNAPKRDFGFVSRQGPAPWQPLSRLSYLTAKPNRIMATRCFYLIMATFN